jgi:hypothetical protein
MALTGYKRPAADEDEVKPPPPPVPQTAPAAPAQPQATQPLPSVPAPGTSVPAVPQQVTTPVQAPAQALPTVPPPSTPPALPTGTTSVSSQPATLPNVPLPYDRQVNTASASTGTPIPPPVTQPAGVGSLAMSTANARAAELTDAQRATLPAGATFAAQVGTIPLGYMTPQGFVPGISGASTGTPVFGPGAPQPPPGLDTQQMMAWLQGQYQANPEFYGSNPNAGAWTPASGPGSPGTPEYDAAANPAAGSAEDIMARGPLPSIPPPTSDPPAPPPPSGALPGGTQAYSRQAYPGGSEWNDLTLDGGAGPGDTGDGGGDDTGDTGGDLPPGYVPPGTGDPDEPPVTDDGGTDDDGNPKPDPDNIGYQGWRDSFPDVPAPELGGIDVPGYNPITLPEGGLNTGQVQAVQTEAGGPAFDPGSSQYGFDALKASTEQYKNDLVRELDARMASRGTLGSSIETGETGQIGGRVQTAYQQGLAQLAAQERGLGLQERGQEIGKAQFAVNAGIQERAMALQAQGMAADQAFNQASMEVQAQITQNAQALQKYGIEAGLAQQYAQMWEDKTYKAQVLELQKGGMAFDQALAKAAQDFYMGAGTDPGYYYSQLNQQGLGQSTDFMGMLGNILTQIDPSQWPQVFAALGLNPDGSKKS